MKLRAWTETRPTRTIDTGDGPMVVRQGDVVIVIVAESWDEATRTIAEQMRTEPRK
jgi:hypothetical protein